MIWIIHTFNNLWESINCHKYLNVDFFEDSFIYQYIFFSVLYVSKNFFFRIIGDFKICVLHNTKFFDPKTVHSRYLLIWNNFNNSCNSLITLIKIRNPCLMKQNKLKINYLIKGGRQIWDILILLWLNF